MENLLKLRGEKGMNQLKLGMEIGVDQATISGYELGRNFPSVENLLKLCELFNVSTDFLLDRTNIKTPVNQLVVENFGADELELLALYRRLPPAKRERAIGILTGLLG